MTTIITSYWRSLALAGVFLLSPGIVAAQAKGTGQTSSQPPMSASGGAMPAGGTMEKHDAMSGMAEAPMQDGMQMPSKPSKMSPMAKSRRPARHRRHAAPRAHRRHATPAPMPTSMPAAGKPMPMQDDM